MPRYFFHVDDGELLPDHDGTELRDIVEARSEAVRATGTMLAELDGEFWRHGGAWTMHVVDDDHRLLFSLHFSGEVSSGDVRYIATSGDQQKLPPSTH